MTGRDYDTFAAVRPRWWRLDPQSRIELWWGPSPDDDYEESFSHRTPFRVVATKRCVSLRPFKDEWYEGVWTRLYGAWWTFDLIPDRTSDRGDIHGLTTLVDGVPMIDVYALEAPTIGNWSVRDEDNEAAA